MQRTLSKIFGTSNDREIKRMVPLVEQTNRLEAQVSELSDAGLQALTASYRQRLDNGEPLDDLLPEAFATVREASKRTLGQRHYDMQLMGGVVLHRGSIAEMKTGEGKTLVATLPSYLNGLTGRGVHVVTVNDYLARRDAEWMGQVHRFLGLSVGVIVHGIDDRTRIEAYGADIAYSTNNELGFDYLRDNMKFSAEHCVQRDLPLRDRRRGRFGLDRRGENAAHYLGSIRGERTQLYAVANRVIPRLAMGTKGEASKGIEETGDFWIDEKAHSATLTEEGIHKAEKLLAVGNLYDPEMLPVIHAVNQALMAHSLKKVDVDYVVKPGEDGRKEVVIVDEHTGRLMPGRRWSDGLHQAVEAKEGIPVRSENQTLASVTFQNFFRMYEKIAGMTGTADTEAAEFAKTYDLNCVLVPTNRPMIRADLADVVFKTRGEKLNAIADEIKERHRHGTARAGGDDLDRGLGDAFETPEEARHPAQRPQREEARERGGDRRPGRSHGSRDDFDEHGGSRYGHRAGRQSRVPRVGEMRTRQGPRGIRREIRAIRGRVRRRTRRDPHHGRPSYPGYRATREPTHRQPVEGPFGTPGRSGLQPVLFSRWKTICCASSRPTGSSSGGIAWGWKRARRSKTGC